MFSAGPSATVRCERNAGAIAAKCETLLNESLRSFYHGALRMPNGRLEYDVVKSTLTIRVDSSKWFMRQLAADPDNALRIAREYIERTNRLVDAREQPASSTDNTAVKYNYKPVCKYDPCQNKGTCKYEHPEKCRETTQTSTCNQWYHPKEIIKLPKLFVVRKDTPKLADRDKDYTLKVRKELQRNLVLFPKKHRTNQQLVVAANFWQMALDVVQHLRIHIKDNGGTDKAVVSTIALDFGKWESRMHGDSNGLDCHGHAHIILSREAIECLQVNFLVLQGRTDPPEDYLEDDLADLTKVYAARSTVRTDRELDTLKSRMDKVERKLDRVLAMEEKINRVLAFT